MKERSLVVFTLLAQMALGTLWLLTVLNRLNVTNLLLLTFLMVVALGAAFFHLGSPRRAWRVMSGWRSSWLSREVLCAALCAALLGGLTLAAGLKIDLRAGAWLASLCGLALLVSMTQAYRLRTLPQWNHWTTTASFFITTLLLGSVACGLMLGGPWWAIGAIGLLGAQQISGWSRPGVTSPQTVRPQHLLLVLRGLAAGALLLALLVPLLWLAAFLLVFSTEVLARILFYEKKKPLSVWRWAAAPTSLRPN